MARLFTTGFELGAITEHNAASSLANFEASTDYPRTGTYCAYCYGSDKYFAQTLTGNPQELYIRVAVRFQTGISSGTNAANVFQMFLALFEAGTCHLSLGLYPDDMRLKLVRGGTGVMGDDGGTLLGSGSIVLRLDTWYVIELYAKIANSGGAATVKVNSVTDIGFSGDTASSANEYVDICRFGWGYPATINLAHQIRFDDIAINDTTGDYQNTWAGQGGVYYMRPVADGDRLEWTQSAGTSHWQTVDEIPANTTDYIYAREAGSADLFEVNNLPDAVTSVDMVQVIYQTALEAAGLNTLRDVVRHEGTDYSGVTQYVTAIVPNYVYYGGTPYYTQPGGTAAWGTAEVAALQAGVEVV